MGSVMVYLPLVCVGSGDTAGDIQVFGMRDGGGLLGPISVIATGAGVSYIAGHPNATVVYVTYSHADRLTAFTIDRAAGCLRPLNDVATGSALGPPGSGACYATVDATGRFLLIASYRGHTVTVWRIDADGRIGGLVQSVTAGKCAHCVRLDRSNRFAFVPFLGSDFVAQYRFDQRTGMLAPNEPSFVTTAAGAGPRHVDVHPAGPWLFLVTELDSSLYRFDIDPDRGTLRERQRLPTLPAGYEGRRWSADVHVAPSGRFVYVSNRAHDSIVLFSVAADGTMAAIDHQGTLGHTPRNFALDRRGEVLLVANQESDTVVVFAIDERTGALHPLQTVPVSPAPYRVLVCP
jgi:6-phosphogluconolactonase